MTMEIGRTSLLWPLLLAGLLCACVKEAGAINFNIVNQCSYTVWAAGSPVGGGKELANGESWSVDVPAGTSGGRFWGRTSCTFDASGKGSCQTGDCGGVLACTGYGSVPATLAEYALNQYMNLDFYDISLVDGFNIPLSFAPTKGCTTIACKSDINAVCPSELKVTDGCDSACHKLKDDQYCCTGAYQDRSKCIPTNYSEFFKTQCPQAYSYAYDDATSTFTCPGGTTDYKIVFCP